MVIRKVFANGRRPCVPIESSLARQLKLAPGEPVALLVTARGTLEVMRLEDYYATRPRAANPRARSDR